MYRKARWSAILLVVLLSLAFLLAACQRDRPAPEAEEGWSTSPIVEETTQTPAQANLASPAPSMTVITVETGQAALMTPTPLPLVTVQPTTPAAGAEPAMPSSDVVAPVGPTFAYEVKSGDTLFSIAQLYGTDVETLRQINNLADDTISVGQILQVPGSGPAVVAPTAGGAPGATAEPVQEVIYAVETGDTLSSIAAKFEVDWTVIAAANGIEAPNYIIYRGQELIIPGVEPTPVPTAVLTTHVVQAGETLYGIAIQYGVTLEAVMQVNQITNPDQIFQGQVLVIPE